MPTHSQPSLFALAKIGYHELRGRFDLLGVSVAGTPHEFVFSPSTWFPYLRRFPPCSA